MSFQFIVAFLIAAAVAAIHLPAFPEGCKTMKLADSQAPNLILHVSPENPFSVVSKSLSTGSFILNHMPCIRLYSQTRWLVIFAMSY